MGCTNLGVTKVKFEDGVWRWGWGWGWGWKMELGLEDWKTKSSNLVTKSPSKPPSLVTNTPK